MNATEVDKKKELEDIELALLLEGVFRHYGIDFRGYSLSAMRRRVRRRMDAEGLRTISALQERVLHDTDAMGRLMHDMTVHATAMFRDPSFFLAFRHKIVPVLRTYPRIRIWHAGCSTGEEVLSTAILLQEEGLSERARIYATDLSEEVLAKAKMAIYPLAKMQEYTSNYLRSGGRRSFSAYYTARYDGVMFTPSLLENVVFSQHSLVSDCGFGEFNLILCRNVMIYFGRELRERVLRLLRESLVSMGMLAIGRKESLALAGREEGFEEFDAEERIYRKAS